MAENIDQNLDLEKILATLANLPRPEAQPSQDQQQIHDANHNYHNYQHVAQTYPHESRLPYNPSADPRLIGRPALQHQRPSPKPQDRPSTPSVPLIDPSTITEWKQGLRCVSKLGAQNPEFAPTIRKLMKDQEQNVNSWESGRMRVIEDHKTPEREKEELDQYDAKVYRASRAMVESQTSALKSLGVPFFGVKPYLVVNSTEEPTELAESKGAEQGGKITKTQLLELQRKMLNHLMELYGD
ncbi:hypothetical protein N0V83_000663 [Neocucurbitaria cava]|uniref:Uncharacterized protein n=1 Tax=Neocucurbitaria cava TaxID=798079 RepID=A0A9W8YJ31_9PLEO|nr:hypothetical protein N0V83_000663 [Neocucurbitaria cava]